MLKIVKRGKKGIYQITGTVGGERYRESTGTASEPHAQVLLAHRQSEALDRAVWGAKRTTLFAEAVSHYLEQGGEPRFVDKLLDRFGAHKMSDISRVDVSQYAASIYPGATPQTLNRQVYSPLIAIFRAAHEAGMCTPHEFKRPKQPEREAVRFARDGDLANLLPHCGPRLKAAVLMLSFTAARASEVCRVEDPDVDWDERTVLFRRTKSGRPRTVPLAPLVYKALLPLRARTGPLLGFKQRYSLNQAIARACRRAGLAVMTSHKIGRHGFAARLLKQGKTLKELQEAGGWSANSLSMLGEIYGHLERKAVDAAIRSADTDLAQMLTPDETVIKLRRVGNA